MNTPRSNIPKIVWPAIPSHEASVLMGLQFQLQQSQWWSAEELQTQQFRQLEPLLGHANETVPYYREVFQTASFDPVQPLTPARWSQIPLLSRDTLQERADVLQSTNIPKQHGNTFQKKTSGSTGRQLCVTDTDANRLNWMAITLRDHLWQGRDFQGGLVAIRSGRSAHDPLRIRKGGSWGPSTGKIYDTGPSTVFYHVMPIAQQADLLQKLQPEYLLVYPSNALRLAEYFRTHRLTLPSLQEVMTYGESLLPETRSVCQDIWGVRVADMYSCEEVGYVALQCPEYDHYHCQSESLLVEVLDDEGNACAAGEIGRVVLTSLHNFAMPLIRYENLDYAEVGQPCPCGRGLPVLNRIMGRKRNMAVAPNGRRFWPQLSPEIWSAIDGIEELQLVQTAKNHIDVRVVTCRTLNAAKESELTSALRNALGQPYSFAFSYQNEILRHANGKYERFICSSWPQ